MTRALRALCAAAGVCVAAPSALYAQSALPEIVVTADPSAPSGGGTLNAHLEARLAMIEAKTDPKRLAMFSRFEGIVMIDADGRHPSAHGHAPGHPHGPHGHQGK